MPDILPRESRHWQTLERHARELLASYGYREIRLPILERSELFRRGLGEITDIVEKEMYSFEDRNGDSLTLRPEGTAGCARAVCQHNLALAPQKLWYQGPMFRHERPQKGRQRQFHQLGVEAFGLAGADVDAELILLSARLWRRLGIAGKLRLQLNSLGDSRSRARYRQALVDYLSAHRGRLDEDSRRRLAGNPLRILDSKSPALRELLDGAPALHDFLDADSRAHFRRLRDILDAAGVDYSVNQRLVRGLDYYNRTVFEWLGDSLGAQDAVCGGGRYDGLAGQLGGKPTLAAGFAIGLERLVLLLQAGARGDECRALADVCFVSVGDEAQVAAFALAEALRDAAPGLAVQVNCGGGSFRSQMKRADKSGARLAVILGEREMRDGVAGLKALRGEAPGAQASVAQAELAAQVVGRLR